ncbi:hypothetical protein D3C87_345590 [compost metagenome]
MVLPYSLYLMAFLYILAGINHFRVPRLYIKMIPSILPTPKTINIISGATEIILGVLLCVPQLSSLAAWGIIIMLIAVFPANVYMYINEKASLGLPKWVRLIRLPIQLMLMYWAYLYT